MCLLVPRGGVSLCFILSSLCRGAHAPCFTLPESPSSSLRPTVPATEHPAPPSPRRPASGVRRPALGYSGGISRPQATPRPAPATPCLLPLAPSYTARALPFAEPVSACGGVACLCRGVVLQGGVVSCPARGSDPSPHRGACTKVTASRILRSKQVSDQGPAPVHPGSFTSPPIPTPPYVHPGLSFSLYLCLAVCAGCCGLL